MIAARSTLLAVHRGDHRRVMHEAAYAVATSPPGQLGSTLGNALAASTAARIATQGQRAIRHVLCPLVPPALQCGRCSC